MAAKKKTKGVTKTKGAARAVGRTAKKAAPKKAAAKRAAPKRAATKAAPGYPQICEVVHWEIQSQDPTRLHDFYAKSLGWSINANNPMNYGMVSSGGREGIDGGIGGSPGPGSRVLVYAAVPDIPETLARIVDNGGRIVMPRSDVGPVVMALYQDPEGNLMGLVEG